MENRPGPAIADVRAAATHVLPGTSEDDLWWGPSSSHLTAYIEQNEGLPLVALQDSLNIDDTQLGVDLRSVTENRAVCGCNGGAEGERYSLLDCWDHGDEWRNGKELARGRGVLPGRRR